MGWPGLGWAAASLSEQAAATAQRGLVALGSKRCNPTLASPTQLPTWLSCTTTLPTHHLAELHSTPAHPPPGFPAPAGSLAFFIFRSRTTAFYFVNDVQARLGLGWVRGWAVWCLWPSRCISALLSM